MSQAPRSPNIRLPYMGAFYRQISNLYMLTIPGTVFLQTKKRLRRAKRPQQGFLSSIHANKSRNDFCAVKKKRACGMLGGLNRILKLKQVPLFACIRRYLPLFAAIRRYSPLFTAICRYIHCNIRRYSPLFAASSAQNRLP